MLLSERLLLAAGTRIYCFPTAAKAPGDQTGCFSCFWHLQVLYKGDRRGSKGTWNDRISCLYLAGALVLCEHTWFDGRRVRMLTAGKVTLGWLGFDNVTSSFFTV
jgi:hypothetical protein